MNIKEALQFATDVFDKSILANSSQSSLENLTRDAEELLCFCLEQSSAYLKTWPEKALTETQLEAFKKLVEKRSQNYPIAYLTGEQAFWNLDLHVNESVLIPRPETECLVEWVLDFFHDSSALSLLDLGTGTGGIAFAVATEKQHWSIKACDKSVGALECAKQNMSKLKIKNVELIESDWFSEIPINKFDCIVSNPPYVEENAKEFTSESICFEPESALKAGIDGLDAIRKICSEAGRFLKTDCPLVIEHGSEQAAEVKNIFENHQFYQVKCHKDYAGLDRFTTGFRKPDG